MANGWAAEGSLGIRRACVNCIKFSIGLQFLQVSAEMNIRQLRHFLAVIDLGSLSAAAEAVHLSQPALSRSLRALENLLRVPPSLMWSARGGWCSMTTKGHVPWR